ncbi:hypothetical protein IWW55_003717 [Coemansia sp. RSA 2706]|nr:hypothetical protein IWW55_003717 [Coemansia sp. RSA 2706]
MSATVRPGTLQTVRSKTLQTVRSGTLSTALSGSWEALASAAPPSAKCGAGWRCRIGCVSHRRLSTAE